MSRHSEEILILAKTYPTPSSRYRETTCVAGLTGDGNLRRIFPIPYRLISPDSQFKRWEWIRAIVSTTSKDQRPESRRIDVDTIDLLGKRIGTEHGWFERLQLLGPHVVDSFFELEERRKRTGATLGIIRPTAIVELQITPAKEPDWTEDDLEKLMQDGLFDTQEMKERIVLKKIPFDFYYRYISGESVYRHKITDWEAGMLYLHCVRNHGSDWENSFRDKFEVQFRNKDLLFLMGTIHRFPDQWLIVGVIYPPRRRPESESPQLDLGLGL